MLSFSVALSHRITLLRRIKKNSKQASSPEISHLFPADKTLAFFLKDDGTVAHANFMSILFLLTLYAFCSACSSSGENSSPDAETQPSTDGAIIDGVGDQCGTGCIGSALCANASDSCETGYCLFDGRDADQSKSYCTADCTTIDCPMGYTCTEVPFKIDKACVADAAICGDGIMQRGEVCDDGNTISNDGCLGDCSQIDTPFDEQWRINFTATVKGMYVPEGATEALSFEIEVSDQGAVPAFGKGCELVLRTIASGNPNRRYYVGSCGANGFVSISMDMVSDNVAPPRPCVNIRLPHSQGTLLGPGGAKFGKLVSYCTGIDGPQTSQVNTTNNGDGTGNTTGVFTGSARQMGGGCDGNWAPISCPQIIGDVDFQLQIDIKNDP